MNHFVFPKWTNALLPVIGAVVAITPIYVVGLVWFGASPRTTDVGYAPEQIVPFSHRLHAGELGIDCRYCHNTVELAAHAAIPPTQTCMGCHSAIHPESPKLAEVRRSFVSGEPVEWTRVHDLPDYAYFDHSAHVTRGVSCVSCHGRVDKMEVVYQHERLSMGWCLECHREPEKHIRDPKHVFDLAWKPADTTQIDLGRELRELNRINPSTDCSACHR